MSIQSKTAIATGDGKFLIDTTTIANLKKDELIIKIKAAGLCHTDFDSLTWGKSIVIE